MQEVFEKTTSGLEHEKIKTNYAEIIIKHPLEKPYYAIIYFDLTDGELHEGFGSYCLEYVVEWKRDYFEIVDQVAEEFAADLNVGHKNGWIPCSEKLPEDGDHRFYMCIVENHEEDLPMFCQFVEELGFGYWQDIFDKDSLGFVDSEFSTNEELGYEKVIAWQPLPGPYEEKEND